MDDFNERIAKLVERHEALTVSIELHDHQIEANAQQIKELVEENKRTARESRLFQRFVLNMGMRMDERIAKLEEDEGQEPSAAESRLVFGVN